MATFIDSTKQAAESQTAVDNAAINPQTDYTGKNAGSNSTAEPLSDREKISLANKNVPSPDTSTEVVQGGVAFRSPPGGGYGRFTTNEGSPNSGAGPTFTTNPSTEPTLSNGKTPGQSSEPVLTYAETQKAVVAKLSTQSVGTTTKSSSTATAGKSVDEKIGKAEKDKEFNITENLLHEYATYTYGLSLHVLTPESYNALSKGSKGMPWMKDAYTIMSSAGRWGERDKSNPNALRRPPEFKDDFYLDDLTFLTVIGLASDTKASNGVEFDFTIIEPYGMTLINRLLLLSKRLNQPNYTENPYVLQIDFFGNKDNGDILNPIPNITKYIPIKIILMNIKVDSKGTSYTCKAVAYNHSAFQQSVAAAPADFEITARTVGDFFAAGKNSAELKRQYEVKNAQRQEIEKINTQAQERASKNSQNRATLTEGEQKLVESLESAYKTAIVTKSYAEAYNVHQLFLQEIESIKHPSELVFEIDPDIAKSEIVYADKTAVNNTPMANKQDSKEAQAAANANAPKKNGQTPSKGPDTKFEKFNVKAGENILTIINKVIRSSKYITSQLKDDKNKDNKEQTVVDFYKVIPSIELVNFDAQQNKWATRMIFKIVKYKAHNYKHPDAPKTDATTCLKDIRKKYEFIYTGANNDIIDFDIKFDTIFFTAVNVLKENKQTVANSQENASAGKRDVKAANVKKNKKNKISEQQQYTAQPNMIVPVVANQQNIGFNSQTNIEVATAADVVNSIYTSRSGGDMVDLKITIVGDPDFIKQDDIFYSPNTESYPPQGKLYTENGSIMTDRGDIFCYIRFRTPVDIDLETGGIRQLDSSTQYLDSSFTGVFKVITVSNEFKNGMFTQTLQTVRIPDQQVIDAVTASIRERTEKSNATKSDQTDLNKLSANTSVKSDTVGNKKEEKYQSYSETQKSVLAATTSTRQEELAAGSGIDTQKQNNLKNVSTDGQIITPDQQAKQNSTSKDGTDPSRKEATSQPVSSESSPPVATQPGPKPVAETDKARTIDNNNLPSGVTYDTNTGLYFYRGVRFQANDSADLQAKVGAIDNGTTIKTTKTSESGTTTVEFDGSKVRPLSKDTEVASLQEQYKQAASDEWNAQRRLTNANNGIYDDDPATKQKVIDRNTQALAAAQAKKQDLERQLAAKGAAPA